MKLSLVIPCFNEAENLPFLIERIGEIFFEKNNEVIFVDNGSYDETPQILPNLIKNYIHFKSIRIENNLGYGNGILMGLRQAKGDVLAWTHADMQTDPADLLKGLKIFEEYGTNIFVKGRRLGRPILDSFFTLGMSIFESIVLKKLMWDINAQPTMFSKDFFKAWENPPLDFSLDLFVYNEAIKQSYPIHRFHVNFANRKFGKSHWNINWSSKFKFIKNTMKYSFNLRKDLKPWK